MPLRDLAQQGKWNEIIKITSQKIINKTYTIWDSYYRAKAFLNTNKFENALNIFIKLTGTTSQRIKELSESHIIKVLECWTKNSKFTSKYNEILEQILKSPASKKVKQSAVNIITKFTVEVDPKLALNILEQNKDLFIQDKQIDKEILEKFYFLLIKANYKIRDFENVIELSNKLSFKYHPYGKWVAYYKSYALLAQQKYIEAAILANGLFLREPKQKNFALLMKDIAMKLNQYEPAIFFLAYALKQAPHKDALFSQSKNIIQLAELIKNNYPKISNFLYRLTNSLYVNFGYKPKYKNLKDKIPSSTENIDQLYEKAIKIFQYFSYHLPQKGSILYINNIKKYGYIITEDNEKIYFSIRDLDKHRQFKQGTKVMFNVIWNFDSKKSSFQKRAINITTA